MQVVLGEVETAELCMAEGEPCRWDVWGYWRREGKRVVHGSCELKFGLQWSWSLGFQNGPPFKHIIDFKSV